MTKAVTFGSNSNNRMTNGKNAMMRFEASADFLSWIHIIIMYLRSKNYAKAVRALKKASYTSSQVSSALMLIYYYGLVEGGLSAVLRYSRKAAYSYHVPSMYMHGRLLREGFAYQDYPQEGESLLKMARILDSKADNPLKPLDPCIVDDEDLIEDVVATLETPQEIFSPKKAAAIVTRMNFTLPKSGKFVKLNGKPEPWEVFKEFSPEIGFKIIRQAAEEGFVTAMYYASSMYRRGYGTEPNPELADAWFYAARKLDVDNKGLRIVDFALN